MSRVWKLGRFVAPFVFALVPLSVKAAAPTPAPSGVKAEILGWIEDAESKLNQLAAAVPESKWSWRPAKGVRSVGDVFIHVAGANYGIPTFIGVKAPEGFDFDTYEKSMKKKADIEKALAASFVHLKNALTNTSDADLSKPIDLFGDKTTVRGAYIFMLSHLHEHLGQSIAYARSNKITPPWTARSEAADKAK